MACDLSDEKSEQAQDVLIAVHLSHRSKNNVCVNGQRGGKEMIFQLYLKIDLKLSRGSTTRSVGLLVTLINLWQMQLDQSGSISMLKLI